MNFYWVVVALIGVLALLSLVTHYVVRRHVALMWLAGALVSGAISTTVFTAGGSGTIALILLALFDTLALYAVAQAMRLVVGKPRAANWLFLTGTGLVALSIAMMIGSFGNVVVQCLPFQIAGFLFVADAVLAVARDRKGWAETAMTVGMVMQLVGHVLRMPFFPSLLDSGQAYPSMASPWLNLFLLYSSSIFVPLVVLSIIARDLDGHIRTFRELSERDGLTALLTRLAFERAAASAMPRFGALVLCDLDHFKSLNDTYGHPAGDEALKTFARLCSEAAPIVGRIGGEEFALLLPGASIVTAEAVANEICAAYRRAELADLPGARLTASCGVTAYGGGETFRETLVKADRALYRAKRQGRDCIVLHGSSQGETPNQLLRSA